MDSKPLVPPGYFLPGSPTYHQGGPLTAPTADPTKPAGGKILTDTPDSTPTTTPTNTGNGLPTDPLQMLGQLYSQGFGTTSGGGTDATTQALANQLAALQSGYGQQTATPVNWTAILVLAAIGFGVWYYVKHKRKAA